MSQTTEQVFGTVSMVDEQNGEWKAICLARDGKVATEARINSIAA